MLEKPTKYVVLDYEPVLRLTCFPCELKRIVWELTTHLHLTKSKGFGPFGRAI